MQNGLLHRKLVKVRIKNRGQANGERHGGVDGWVATGEVEVIRPSVPLPRGTKRVEIRTAIEFLGARERLG